MGGAKAMPMISQNKPREDGSNCCPDKQFCTWSTTQKGCPSNGCCCNSQSTWDPAQHMCMPSNGTKPVPQSPMQCSDGSLATLVSSKTGYHFTGGLMECIPYDCGWGSQLCDAAHCPLPKLSGNACSAGGSLRTHVPKAQRP